MFEKQKIPALVSIGLFTFMSTLDGSIVNVALPTIARELAIPLSQATWVVTIYLVIISGLIVLFGRLGDLLGKTTIFRYGMMIFTIGSLLSGINLGLPFLLFARSFQAIGASMTMSNSFGITSTLFPPNQRARAMSIIAMFVSLGSIAGPAIGGLILSIANWSYIFWINVPIGAIAFWVGNRYLPKEKPLGTLSEVDWLGACQLLMTMLLFFLGMNSGQSIGWHHILVWLLLLLSGLTFASFIWQEKRSPSPLLNLHIFDNHTFGVSVVLSAMFFTVNAYVNILTPFYLQNFRGWSAGMAGIIMMSIPASMFVFAPISGILSDRYNKEIITLIGISGLIVSQIGFLIFGQATPIWLIVTILLLTGMSAGIFQSPNSALVMASVNKQYLGIAGSINALGRNVAFVFGNIFATTILFLLMSRQAGHRVATYDPQHPSLFMTAMHNSLYFSLTLAIVAWLLTAKRLFQTKKSS
ncbi:MAG: MFS transporter [Leuconostoc pseudomesenteroides]|uniref:MFS transporter n=1 Tax=Leuconostoc pseudomesenteroides TaxID=33968 RepID=UPI00301C4E42